MINEISRSNATRLNHSVKNGVRVNRRSVRIGNVRRIFVHCRAKENFEFIFMLENRKKNLLLYPIIFIMSYRMMNFIFNRSMPVPIKRKFYSNIS